MSQDFSSFLKMKLVSNAFPDGQSAPDRSELKPGERREIAVLFLDLGGFTALSERLDHEAVHEISKGVMDALVNITENYGGYVDKIEGDRIMVLFGARKAGENDSERSVSCAFLMLRAINTANDILSDTGVPITARIGINSGPVTVAPDAIGHLTAIGRTVNLASRLEEAANINTILVSTAVKSRCEEMFSWEDVGELDIRGISRPVRAFRPTGIRSQARHRWERISRVSISGFVGRKPEMERLRELTSIMESGKTGSSRLGTPRHLILHVYGEAGIGKSRLIHHFLRDYHPVGEKALVLHGRTASYAQPAYHLWGNLLRDLLDLETDTRIDFHQFESMMNELGKDSELERSLPFLAQVLSIRSDDRRLQELDSGAIALETRIAFRNLLKVLSAGRNLVLVLDDLQWMDSTCMGVLKFVVENLPLERPALFILISRPENDEGVRMSFEFGQGYAHVHELEVPVMENDDCRGMISEMLSCLGSEETCGVSLETEDFLLQHSQGNPFFLEELLLDLAESGILRPESGKWEFGRPIDDIYVPSSLTGLLQSRMDRLSDEQRGSLQKSSVLGFDFRLKLYDMLLEELGMKEDSDAVLGILEERQFLLGKRTAGERFYSFRHVLIHDTAYNTILESNRKLLHGIAARLLEETVTDNEREMADILAHHWERAGNREKAIHWGIINLSHTVETYQHERSMELSRKLEEWILQKPLDDQSVDGLLGVLMGRCDILDLLGRTGEQEALLLRMKDIAREYGRSEWLGKIFTYLGNVSRITRRMEEAKERYTEALNIHRSLGSKLYQSRVLCNLGILSRAAGEPEEANEYLQQALSLNSESEDRRTEGVITGNLGNLYFDQKMYGEAIRYYEKALEINREVGDRRSEGIALGNLGNPYLEMGDVEKAQDYYRQALALHREIGNRRSEGVTLSNLAVQCFDLGRIDESKEYDLAALEIHSEIGNSWMEAMALVLLALIEISQGEKKRALELYLRALALIQEFRMSTRGFDHFDQLYRKLMDSGFSQEEAPRPPHWK